MTAPQNPVRLRAEHRPAGEPALGLSTATPRLSWVTPGAPAGYRQDGYQLEIARTPWGGEAVTETHTAESAEQVLVAWPGSALSSREAASVRVRVRGDGEWSGWSEPAIVEAGLLSPSDWDARFISPTDIGSMGDPAPAVSSTITLPAPVVRARLHLTAHGWYEAQLNGHKVGRDYFGPGWTSYDTRLRYYTYDVTDLLTQGANDLDILLGNGWFRGNLTWFKKRAYYGDRLAALAQLEVLTSDGASHVLATDGSWVARQTNILADDMYDGQTTDLRLPLLGEERSGVEVIEAGLDRLIGAEGPAVQVTEVLPAQRIWRSPAGKLLVDFGQNVVGFPRLTVRGLPAGTAVVITQAEVLEHDELGVRPLRTAKCTDTYYTSGGTDVLEPRFTFHGFRYACVEGVDELDAADIEAVVLGSNLTRTGWFECSEPLLNRLHSNVVWGMRGNFVDVPTDCPQRDERLGWTGDIQVFSPTALYLHDAAGFLSSWLGDLAADQTADGMVPIVVPDVLQAPFAAAAWGDAAVVVPWEIYRATGDTAVLRRQLSSMRGWVDKLDALAGPSHLWLGGFQFGDWLDPDAPPESPSDAKADADVVATACFFHCADLLAKSAAVIGETALAEQYGALADAIRQAFCDRFATADGMLISDAATVYAQAIVWGLLNPEQTQKAGDRLAELARVAAFRISTGFVGTPLITEALSRTGHADIAYRLLEERGNPSWLYSVTMGATTIWERWDSMLPDGTINPGEMTSFNHYALGAVADWMHRVVAGLAPAEPGYRKLLIAPQPGGSLTSAAATMETPYGLAATEWHREGDGFNLSVTVPVGSSAEVRLPGGQTVEVGHGEHHWSTSLPTQPRLAPVTVRDVIDDPVLWPKVVEIVAARGRFTDAAQITAMARRSFDDPAAEFALAISAGGMIPGAEQLRQDLAPLLGG